MAPPASVPAAAVRVRCWAQYLAQVVQMAVSPADLAAAVGSAVPAEVGRDESPQAQRQAGAAAVVRAVQAEAVLPVRSVLMQGVVLVPPVDLGVAAVRVAASRVQQRRVQQYRVQYLAPAVPTAVSPAALSRARRPAPAEAVVRAVQAAVVRPARSARVREVALGVQADRAVMVEAADLAVVSEVGTAKSAACLGPAEFDSEP